MTQNSSPSRRDMLKQSGALAAASAFAGMTVAPVHAGEENTIRVALVGCGGRGTGAAQNALSVKNGPTKLVAMADAFKDRLDSRHRKYTSPSTNRWIPTTASSSALTPKQAIDCLRPATSSSSPRLRLSAGCTTYAIAKGVNVFMEKPVTVDGPTTGA